MEPAVNVSEVVKLFDREARANPMERVGLHIEQIGKAICLTGIFNFVSYWDFAAEETTVTVGAVAEHFRAKGEEVIWRIYAHDDACNGKNGSSHQLSAALSEAGFVAEPSGMFMLADTQLNVSLADVGSFRVRQAASLAEVDDFLAATEQAFGGQHTLEQREAYKNDLANPDHLLFVAYVDAVPVASSRMEVNAPFGQMYGGGVLAAYRGRGIYRAMVAARVKAARERGLAYVCTEAADSSRPILERLGFVAAGRETTWILPPP